MRRAALHRAGIIHRDIKPDNVMLEAGGSLKLLDLGVVRLPGLEDFPPDSIPGTAAYMAPEMFKGEAGNVATDIYALGVTLFRAFTGTYPYGNPDATSAPRQERPQRPGHAAPRSAGLAAGRASAAPSLPIPPSGLPTWPSLRASSRPGRPTRRRRRAGR